MSEPKRIQRKRAKGWQAPLCSCGCGNAARYVGRPSKWGNPWRYSAADRYCWLEGPGGRAVRPSVFRLSGKPGVAQKRSLQEEAVKWFRRSLTLRYPPPSLSELAGHDLRCWCPLVDAAGDPVPCHADVLLELANKEIDQ